MARIKPQTLKGFRDFLPDQMLVRERMMETARDVFRQHGFAPIDTPALEQTDVLLGKGGGETDKQLFRFTDNGGRDVAMRFDLTVPLARYAAQHANALGMPFKRYALGTVWRAEKPQKGRYREFVQCDFDTIGADSTLADAETLVTIFSLFRALGVPEITVRVNSRGILNGFLEAQGLLERQTDVLRAIDKLPKIGSQATHELLLASELTEDQAAAVLAFCGVSQTSGEASTGEASTSENAGGIAEQLEAARTAVGGHEAGRDAIDRLQATCEAAIAAGVEASRLQIDLSIARGLDYYTGIIYETFLDALPGIGSVCSGGRYDNLADLFSSQPLPGVGASLGLDRLLAALEELGQLDSLPATPAEVLVAVLDPGGEAAALGAAAAIRAASFAVEVYPAVRAPKHVFKYADRKGFRAVVLAGSNELEANTWQVKTLTDGVQTEVAAGQVALEIAQRLEPGPAVAS